MRDFKRQILGTIGLGLVLFAAAVPYRITADSLGNRFDPEHTITFLKNRWLDFMSKADRLDIRGNVVYIFIGLSDVELGIDPGEVLRFSGIKGAEAINLGFPAMPADAIPALLERTFRELRERGAREIVLVMKVPVYSLTSQAQSFLRGYDTDGFLLAIADSESFLSGAAGSRLAGLDLWLKKLLLGTGSSSALSYWLYQVALPHFFGATGAEKPRQTITAAKVMLAEGHWSFDRRGKVPWELIVKQDPSALLEANADKTRPTTDAWLQSRFGTLAPSIDQAAYSRFQASSRWARKYGVKTIVFDFSDLFDIDGRRGENAKALLASIDQETARAFQAKFLNLDKRGMLESADFLDSMHLSGSGQVKIEHRLADYLRENQN